MNKIKLTLAMSALLISNIVLADLNTGLIAYYPFNGNVNDESGNNTQIMLNPTIYYTDGINGQGLASTESNNDTANQVVISNPFAGEHFTVSYLVNAKVDHNKTYGDSGIAVWASAAHPNLQSFGMTSSSGNNSSYLKHEYPELIVSNLENNTGLGASLYYANNKLAESKWQHILLTYENGTINVYINGSIAIANKQTTVSPIGRDLDITLKGNDKLDEIRIYNRALSASEAKSLYYKEFPPIVKGAANWVKTPYSVECTNNTTAKKLVISRNKTANYDCEKAGLITNSDDDISIIIKGKRY